MNIKVNRTLHYTVGLRTDMLITETVILFIIFVCGDTKKVSNRPRIMYLSNQSINHYLYREAT